MNFNTFITRIDEEIIEQIIGKPSLKILNIFDSDLTRMSELQRTLLNIYSPIELFENKSIRNSFIDLLKENEAAELLTYLGKEPAEDNYSSLKSVNYKSRDFFEKLLNFFEIEQSEEIENENTSILKSTSVNYPLFKHQRKAITELYSLLYSNRKRALLHMPTGSGKTRTAMNVISDHFRISEPTVVIWLAHTEELCEQAAQEFENSWKNLGNRNLDIIRFWGASNISIENITDGFIVGGLAKVYNLLKANSLSISQLGSHISLIVMDEAHMAIAATYKTILEILLNFNSSLLGLSATPGRTWNDPNADLELSNFFFKKKVTLKVDGYDNPVDYLVEKGYLAKVKNTPLLYDSGVNISEKDLAYLTEYLELPEKFLKSLSEDQQRNILIIQKVEELVTRHNRIILFALNVEHAKLLAICLQGRKINAYSVTSNTEPSLRKRLISQYKTKGDSPIVLCNYGILTTGFDAPQTSCAVISRPTDSLVLYSQMVGRAIRGVNAGGNEEAEIVTVIDTVLPGFDKVQNAFFNWEDIWDD